MKKLLVLLALCLPLPAFADCAVASFAQVATDPALRPINIGAWPPIETQTVSVSGTAAEPAAAWSAGTQYLIFKCDTKTWFAVGPIATVTATTSDLWVEAGETGYVGITTISNQISFIE